MTMSASNKRVKFMKPFYCAAREWGVDLVRSQTIADGAAHCDFRWKFPASGAD